mmetsp:Transcript_15755/g.22489  ORF Transcript_15755/g.22489 Transcript_15755/m.22489 type:complete len:289 (+) Transcript_15755:197-1063(+)|eukprot:CAMPEP_0172424122 /NCGR_PEP_ID=MMETSP1064-20121228/21258_1 /TAXON_ID=202472 /ORGANISM="Aulacoseira subarctica , Strain CCAP 1002/5" /LENGTH=288 /DNA_ID=CAMNT_0013165893 /DNA_START=165 /DNA_END=1031 /DNA_ORIENTATION=+
MVKETISFIVNGDLVCGDLYLPASSNKPVPAVIVGGPMTSVKEQVTGVYAKALSERGIAALALDHRHYGESEGKPRQYEYYQHKIEDLSAGIDYLSGRNEIDSDNLGAIGICLGVGYVVWTAVKNPKIKWLGAIAGYYRDVDEMQQNDPSAFNSKIEEGIAARKQYEATGKAITIPAVALTGEAAMTTPELYDYYGTPRAGVANYTNEFAIMSREHFISFDVQSAAQKLSIPVAMVHSRHAISPEWAEKFYQSLTCDQRIKWIESKGQVDFYDDQRLVTAALDFITGA